MALPEKAHRKKLLHQKYSDAPSQKESHENKTWHPDTKLKLFPLWSFEQAIDTYHTFQAEYRAVQNTCFLSTKSPHNKVPLYFRIFFLGGDERAAALRCDANILLQIPCFSTRDLGWIFYIHWLPDYVFTCCRRSKNWPIAKSKIISPLNRKKTWKYRKYREDLTTGRAT